MRGGVKPRKRRARPRTPDAIAFEELGLALARTCFSHGPWHAAVLAGWFVGEKERKLGRRFTQSEAAEQLDEARGKLATLAPPAAKRRRS